MDLMDATVWVVVLICFTLSGSTNPRAESAEFLRADNIQATKGKDAALLYLLALPNKDLPFNYKRLRKVAKLEDSLEKWADAEGHLAECVEISIEAKNPKSAAASAGYLATIQIKENHLTEAEHSIADAWKYVNEAHDTSLVPYLLHNQGLLFLARGHLEEAVVPIRQSLDLFENAQDKTNAANVRISLAKALSDLGHYELAREQYELAQKEESSSEHHKTLGHLGNIDYYLRDYDKAAERYHQAAELAKDTDKSYYSLWLTNEASALIELNQLDKAAERNQVVVLQGRLAEREAREHAQLNQARIAARRGKTLEATDQFSAVSLGSVDPTSKLEAYSELIRIYQNKGEWVAAREAYQSGLSVVDRRRSGLEDPDNQLSFTASAMKLSQQYIAGLMAHGREAEAFEIAEESRAGMLRRKLAIEKSGAGGPLLPAYREAAKRTNTAYFAYWLAPERSYLWVITGGTFKWYPMPDERELRDTIDRFQKKVQEDRDANSESASLFKTLVEPARQQLGDIKTVVIVPDGPLYSMNFETLRQGSVTAPYWIEDATISVAPSLGLAMAKTGTHIPNRRILLVGDADEWNAEFPHLLKSSEELDRIAAHFPESERTRLAQSHATPDEYEKQELASYRYVHLSTHGAANRNAPLESSIVLSQANGRGKMTARDILKKHVNADLISISACRSAGAITYAGEGLVGLAWAFLSSGAHSVVAGLWDVSEHSSPLIMDSMYRGLAHGKNAAEALRLAKLELLQPGHKYASPYYWGPLMLYRGAGAK